MGKTRYIIGDVFGRLTVVAETDKRTKAGSKVYLCRCSCGVQKEVSQSNLVGGTVKSCGCLLKEPREGRTQPPRLPPGIAAANAVLHYYRSNAKKRNHSWGLSYEEFMELTKQDCHYCGAPPMHRAKARAKKENGEYLYNGIDRKDNTKGYELDNVLPCCPTCNRMKGTLDYFAFAKHISEVQANLLQKGTYNAEVKGGGA